MLRLIQQYLFEKGYHDVARDLETKSNVRMEESVMQDFRNAVMSGNYAAARDHMKSIKMDNMKQIEYQLFEQEYLELVETGRRLEAIGIMQRELMPRVESSEQRAKLHNMAQLIMCSGKSSELRRNASWKGSGDDGRLDLLQKVQSQMPANQMLQPMRLENLMKQGIAFQIYNCKYHNVQHLMHDKSFSLLEDHQCQRQFMIPTKCLAILQKHKDEVWQVKFSPSGAKLSTIGKDNILYIWSLTKLVSSKTGAYRYRVKCTHEIKGHSKQVNSINWSQDQDDKWIVTASHDCSAKVWDTKTGQLIVEINRHSEAVTVAAFVPGTNQLVTAAVDKQIILWEIKQSSVEGTFEALEQARVETRNYLDIAVSSGRLVAMGQNYFQVFNSTSNGFKEALEDSELTYEIEMSDTVTSIALSKDGRYLLANVSLKQPRLELFDLATPKRAELVRRYKGGHEQQMFVLRCAFGGVSESFVLCGSEDATVSIWNKDKGDIIAKIGSNCNGHSQVINCVNWSPSDPYLFATASDDHTVRLWGTENMTPCILESKSDFKRIDHQSFSNGHSKPYRHSDDEDDDDYDDEEDEGHDDDERMEDDDHISYPRRQILQSTRVDQIQEEDEEEDWAEER